MITINKPMIAMAALIAAGLVAVIDMAQSRPQDTSPAAKVAARFPQANELMLTKLVHPPPVQSTASTAKSDKLRAPASTCVREHWPYIADECLVATEGAKPRRPARTIVIERRIATATAAQLASR